MPERILRRYDLPAAAVRAATERRLAGDWRGACAAVRIQLQIGPGLAGGFADDLRYLAPELVRWHLLGADHEPLTHRSFTLRHDGGLALTVRAANRASGPAPLVLALGPVDPARQAPFHNCLWDARHAVHLREHLGRGPAPWYLDALRTGDLTPSALPPLVQAALFPDRPPEPYAPMPGVEVPDRIHVQCPGGRHYVGFRNGELSLLSHTDPVQVRRERVLQAMGGPVDGCHYVLDSWIRRTGRLPRRLRAVAHHMYLAASHGDAGELARLLDAGVDPRGVRGPQGRSLLDLADRIDDPDVVRRLRDAGGPPVVVSDL